MVYCCTHRAVPHSAHIKEASSYGGWDNSHKWTICREWKTLGFSAPKRMFLIIYLPSQLRGLCGWGDGEIIRWWMSPGKKDFPDITGRMYIQTHRLWRCVLDRHKISNGEGQCAQSPTSSQDDSCWEREQWPGPTRLFLTGRSLTGRTRDEKIKKAEKLGTGALAWADSLCQMHFWFQQETPFLLHASRPQGKSRIGLDPTKKFTFLQCGIY